MHTLTVTGTSADGQSAAATIQYTVAAPPSAQVTTPTTASCTGSVANGHPLDTAMPGHHSFTITAISKDGQVTVATVSYTVVLPDNHFTVLHIKTYPGGAIGFEVEVPGPGTIEVLETAWNDNAAHAAALLQPAARRFVDARKHTQVMTARLVHLMVTPNARGGLLVGHHTYQVTLRLWVSDTPTGVRDPSAGFYGLHLPGG
jgi:hypothetical protein